MNQPLPFWREMTVNDERAVDEIGERVHPGFPERIEVLMEKHALCPQGCHVLQSEGLLGYVLSHPWTTGDVPALDQMLGEIPDGSDAFYIHDLALLPEARGTGAARKIVTHLAAHARAQGFKRMALCAVNNSVPFWEHFGFAVIDDPDLTPKLAKYELQARYMIRRLASDQELGQ